MRWVLLLALSLPIGAQEEKVHSLCQQCHTEAASDVESHPHFAKGVSCDACHGKSEKHRLASGNVAPDRVATREEVAAMCGSCHPSQRKSYETSKHWTALQAGKKSAQCATCHGNHALRSIQVMQTSCERCHAARPAECSGAPKVSAKLRYAGCHEPHGFAKK